MIRNVDKIFFAARFVSPPLIRKSSGDLKGDGIVGNAGELI